MIVGEVKGLMYENVLLIDIRTGVVHYPGAVRTSVLTVGVRIGVMMDIVECEEESERTERGYLETWYPDS